MKSMINDTAVWSGMFPSLECGVTGLNITSKVPVMIMSRHIVFCAVISILSKPLFEVKK